MTPDRPTIQQIPGRAVKEIRVSRAITQKELAVRFGRHTTYIGDIE